MVGVLDVKDEKLTYYKPPLNTEASAFVTALRACANKKDLYKGIRLHAYIIKRGLLEASSSVANSLVSMYAKCAALAKARHLLEELPVRDAVSWSALIGGYAHLGQGEKALNCLDLMQCEGLFPDAVTFICALKACGSKRDIDKGQQIHDEISRRGLLQKDITLGNALVDMYAKCGALSRAKRVLEELPTRDVVSWSTLISGYARQGQGRVALDCFEQMHREGLSPNAVTFICILKACASIGAIDKGEHIKDEIVKQGLLKNNILLGTALVDMYAKCGALAKARHLLLNELPSRDVIAWSALIAGYVEQGQGEDALECFEKMQEEGLTPNAVTLISVLKACGCIEATDKGEHVHDEIVRQGWLAKDAVLGNALVDMYAKCGALAKAHQVLEYLPSRNTISWNSLIAGYTQRGKGKEALKCFEWMQGEGLSPDEVTFVCVLKACGSIGEVEKGIQIQNEILTRGLLGINVEIGVALVNMYSKCGLLVNAQEVLDELVVGNVIAWSALIARHAQNGQAEAAVDCFELMQCKGISPNDMAFIYTLKACGSLRALEKGKHIHDEIIKQGFCRNNVALCTALVDMYAKCGAFSKAQEVLDELPFANVTSWSALIAGYAQHGQCQDALYCFDCMHRRGLFPDAVTFSCVLNACRHSGLLDEGQILFENMRSKYGIVPSIEHYACMVDLYGRAGHFDKAMAVIKRIPLSDHSVVWSALLGACQKWGEVNIGRWAFEHAIQIDKIDAVAYVCMANIYAAAGMQEEASSVEALRVQNKAWMKQSDSKWHSIGYLVDSANTDVNTKG